jgi:hypothetical protein
MPIRQDEELRILLLKLNLFTPRLGKDQQQTQAARLTNRIYSEPCFHNGLSTWFSHKMEGICIFHFNRSGTNITQNISRLLYYIHALSVL